MGALSERNRASCRESNRVATSRRTRLLGVVALLGLVCASASGQGSRFAVRFHGIGTGQVDRIKVPLASAPAMNVGSDFTIDLWMRGAYANNSGVVSVGQNGDGWITGNILIDRDVYGGGDYGDYGIAVGRSSGRSVLAFGTHNGSWGETIVGTNHVGDNLWHHVAVTRTRSNGLMRIYVDGAPDAAGAGPTGDLSYRVGRATAYPASDPYLVMGAEKHDAGSAYPSFNGSIDEVRIWSRALSPTEVLALRSRILPPEDRAGLAAYWRLEEGTNRPILDTASGYTGTLFSAKAGVGEWTSWAAGSNAAPIPLPAPTLAFRPAPTNALSLSWFVPRNNRSEVQYADGLSAGSTWLPFGALTNILAVDSNVTMLVSGGAGTARFYRVRSTPYR